MILIILKIINHCYHIPGLLVNSLEWFIDSCHLVGQVVHAQSLVLIIKAYIEYIEYLVHPDLRLLATIPPIDMSNTNSRFISHIRERISLSQNSNIWVLTHDFQQSPSLARPQPLLHESETMLSCSLRSWPLHLQAAGLASFFLSPTFF